MLRLQSCLTLLVILLTLAACSSPAAPPAATTAPTSKPAAAQKPAETKPAGSPAAASASPAAASASPAASPAAASAASPAAGSPAGGKRLRVGLVTDVGKVDDKSFNQSAWEGVLRAQRELGAEVKFLETTDPKDYAKNIDQFGQDGYDVIVTVGFAIGQATQEAAAKYKNIRFIGVDQFQEKPTDNLVGLIFDEDKAGYLAGALAGLLTKSNVVAAVLGTDLVPPVVKFGKGYEAGAKAVKPDIRVISAYHPGGLARGFSDPDWGKNTTIQMIQQQADVIFGAGGQTGNGALLGALERNVLAIGVDTDQWETLPQVRPVLVSSAMKLITPGVFELVKAAGGGSFKSGNFTGQVGLAPFHDNASKVPEAAKAKLAEIDAGLKNGSIRTGVTLP
ncbi:MAG: BMP family ABC transporter substrate-binding protein [Chloroflexota bacterium]